MTLVIDSRTPANGTKVGPGTAVNLHWAAHLSGAGETFTAVTLYSRKNGGSWSGSTKSHPGTAVSMDVNRTLAPSDIINWYIKADHTLPGGGTVIYQAGQWGVSASADTTAPVISDVSPAAGNVAPGGSGVVFAGAATDNYRLDWLKLYVDDALEQTWTSTGLKSYIKRLPLGPHTYRFEAADSSGNTASTGNININVTNGLPVVPPGAITVAGQAGAVSVANLGNVAVSWPAFLDGNPEDSLTYTLENRAAGGAWAEVATGITSPTYEWSPNIGLGAAELRVKANDGTTDSAYLTRTGITIVSSQSPNAPTLISPAGGETWREGETHDVTWTPAATEHPEGLPCTYEIQFSALGDFSDAVTITSTADDGTYPWTLATGLV